MFDDNERTRRFRSLRLPVRNGDRISANIAAIEAHGHEIGHTVYEVSSAGETLLIWGDIVHVPSIQFKRPEITWGADADQDKARATRQTIFGRALGQNIFVAGSHLDFPGVGKVEKEGIGYTFEAI